MTATHLEVARLNNLSGCGFRMVASPPPGLSISRLGSAKRVSCRASLAASDAGRTPFDLVCGVFKNPTARSPTRDFGANVSRPRSSGRALRTRVSRSPGNFVDGSNACRPQDSSPNFGSRGSLPRASDLPLAMPDYQLPGSLIQPTDLNTTGTTLRKGRPLRETVWYGPRTRTRISAMSARVLIVTQDVLLPQMAGPAIRAWHMAERLARDHDVKLLTTSPRCHVTSNRFHVSAAGRSAITEAEAWCDVMVLQGYVTSQHPVLEQSSKIIVFDVYDPLHLETLAFTTGVSSEVRSEHVQSSIATLNYQLARGDFLICASERQRDFYLGQLAALGRINTTTYDNDPTLRRLIDVVPFGLPNDDPEHSRPVLKGDSPRY